MAIVFLLAAFCFLNASFASADETQIPVLSQSRNSFQLGVVVENPEELNNIERLLDRDVDIFLWYQSMDQKLDLGILNEAARDGRTIQLSWEPIAKYTGGKIDPSDYKLSNFAHGDFDAHIRRWARELRDFEYPVLFRPMCEMNGNWSTWSGNMNGNKPGDYVEAWKHIYQIFKEEGADNVSWVWSPNRDNTLADAIYTFDNYYPGDEYVDYVGLSGYNWGTMYRIPEWYSSWQSFEQVFGNSYDVFSERTNKPIILAEVACTEMGGNKADWITNSFAQLPVRFPRIVAVTWFNLNKETDWRIQSSQESTDAFKNAIHTLDSTQGLCGPPKISLRPVSTYWSNYADYCARTLSVLFVTQNVGMTYAHDLTLTRILNSNKVETSFALPYTIGDLAVGDSKAILIRYTVPNGFVSYRTFIYASINDECGHNFRNQRLI